MKIPKTFELMGTKIEVVEDVDIMQNDDANGMAVYRLDKIKIAPSTPVYCMTQDKKEHVFLHELMHWIFYKLNKEDLRKDENLVDMIADLLHQAIKSADGKFEGNV